MPVDNRITARMAGLAKKGECALICYVVAGYPDLRTSQSVIEKLVEGGADIIEIGIPFSDPIADGPTIQAASHAALEKGVRPGDALRLAARIRKKHPDLPLIIMTYTNILDRRGFEQFIVDSKRSGIDGFIIPDMPMEEAEEYVSAASRNSLATVFLASPNTKRSRLDRILSVCTGFLYLVSVFGITGARSAFEKYSLKAVQDVKQAAMAKVPVAVGFGISKPGHVKQMISAGADAVIVGSAIVDTIAQAAGSRDKMLRKVRSYAHTMKTACK